MSKKQLVLLGWTNLEIKRGGTFTSSICEKGDYLNGETINFCKKTRRGRCVDQKRCNRLIPHSHNDRLAMVGKKPFGQLTYANRNKIDKILARAVIRCRAVRVTIERVK